MVMGPKGCGKTTLAKFIEGDERPVKKSQDVVYGTYTMDIPSAYIEGPWLYGHLITLLENQGNMGIILVDQSSNHASYPPNFAKVFNCPIIGVITKSDLKPENEDYCKRQLEKIGVNPPYLKITTKDITTLETLKKHVLEKNRVKA